MTQIGNQNFMQFHRTLLSICKINTNTKINDRCDDITFTDWRSKVETLKRNYKHDLKLII